MRTTVTEQPATTPSGGDWETSRRDKLRRIVETGRDPWGSRFDDHASIAALRERSNEIVLRLQDGRRVLLPDLASAGADFDFRKWLSEQGPGDMTGQIQLFVGQQQVGDDWALAQCLDLGDILGVDGELRRTKTGELSIFAKRLTILSKSLAAPPEKHHGLTDPELRQRLRYLDLAYGDGVMPRFLNRTKIVRSIRETLNNRGYVEVE